MFPVDRTKKKPKTSHIIAMFRKQHITLKQKTKPSDACAQKWGDKQKKTNTCGNTWDTTAAHVPMHPNLVDANEFRQSEPQTPSTRKTERSYQIQQQDSINHILFHISRANASR
jgi:hypothetical protein